MMRLPLWGHVATLPNRATLTLHILPRCRPICNWDVAYADSTAERLFSLVTPPSPYPTLLEDPGSTSTRPPELLTRAPEHELIDRVLAGDMTAARELYNAHVGAVFRLALRITADEPLAHDATQDAFVRVFRQRRDSSGIDALIRVVRRFEEHADTQGCGVVLGAVARCAGAGLFRGVA